MIAVLDANVLFPMVLRDTILRCAAAGMLQIRWSSRILDEVTRNLVSDYGMRQEGAEALRQVMEEAFPDAMAEGWEALEHSMLNDPKDRHLAAAAAAAGADSIVTSNIRDFQNLPPDIQAIAPDALLCSLLRADPDLMLDVLERQAAGYRRPSLTLLELVARLSISAPEFARLATNQFKSL